MNIFQKKFLSLFMIGFLAVYIGVTKFAFAEDDEDDKYEESKDDEDDEEDNENKSETTTQTVRLPDRYVTKTIIENIIKKDSDRDGLLDENDPHPDIAEIYIVNDVNQNGIDDKYDLNSYGN